VVGFIVGRRGQNEADQLLEIIKRRTDDTIPFFTSDDLGQYENAILKVYGIKENAQKTGKRGRPKKPKLVPPTDLKYAKIKKVRENGRIVKIDTEVVFGNEDDVKTTIKQSPVSKHVNNSFVERNNLTMREGNRRLTRKTLGFSKMKPPLISSLALYFGYYHFVKTHKGLRIENADGTNRKWTQRTPMMSAEITDHVWTVEELITSRVPIEY